MAESDQQNWGFPPIVEMTAAINEVRTSNDNAEFNAVP